MKEQYQIRCSKYISKLDVREKASLIMVLTKIKSGILLMSSIYFRFFQTVLPMLSMIYDHEDNKDLQQFVCKKFSSILRTYIRTNDLSKKEQPSVYALLSECYDINLDPSVKQIESHIVVSLRDIDESLDMLLKDILDMTQSAKIDGWKDVIRYGKISDTLNRLTSSIVAAYEDVSKAFFDGASIADVDEYIKNKLISSKALNSDIDNINVLIMAIEFNGSMLHCLYSDICKLQYNIEMAIDIVNPINTDDCDKSIKEMYADFGDMNDEAIKRDTHRNGFDIALCGNKKKEEDKDKRRSPFPLFEFEFGKNPPPFYHEEDEE